MRLFHKIRSTKALILLAFISISFISNSQDWSRYGNKSFNEKDYYGAAYYFNEAIQLDSTNLDLIWIYAEASRLSNNYVKAGQGYKKLMDKDEKIRFPNAVFYRADMLKRQEKYEEAGVYFQFYRDICTDKKDLLYKRAKIEIQACLLADSWQTMDDVVEIKHPPFYLNSFDAEFSPNIISDTQLLFSSLRFDSLETKQISQNADQYKSIIYEATLADSIWTISPLDSVINDTLNNNANPAITPDSSQMYFTRCNEKGCAIYVSNWYKDHWENAVKLGPNINAENATSTQPFVATLKNGKTYLFFSSNRERTRGKMDIWTVEIKNNGTKYGRAKNAGRFVNTKEDEITPFYNIETEELFFSSIYHEGFGGFDIFKSKGMPRKFAEPKNVGKPINSAANDLYYTYSNVTQNGAFISNRSDGYALKGETCCNDIYFFGPRDTTQIDTLPLNEIPVEEDLVVRLQAVQFLPLALYFDNDKPNSNSRQTVTEKTYEETFDNYLLRKPKFQQEAPNRTEIDSFFVQNVAVGFIKLQMLSDSLIKYLQKGYKLQLGVKGFTSPLGDADYNDNLALRRISAIQNYLYQCKEGALQPAIDSGLLKFRQIPFGEFFSLGKVSDDYKSQKHSVYSASASEARKVEIIWVEQTLPGDSNAIAIFEKTTHNFGELPVNSVQEHTFKFTNSGEKSLQILSVQKDCDCMEVEYSELPILPGESSEIIVKLNTTGRKGMQFHGLVITTNAKIPEKKLFIRGVMQRVLEE
tara:strand:- start:21395 stop:23656 length:2262 start_codon:yes stop_codon:yes gene_type:complete